ncbi:Basic form of pathoproteinsis-related protein 1 [Hibiscus syriacus]|uniref:Basic form of pathoproteinsis-related protein 1 n=1 Tax=Hibiscus syriacus TaxID=106335 RepID=A0A6A2XHB4_HIBSY|nr:Basic form of pathoproteinsis-related protein 1 [Hibiscus syriacus]
MTWDNTVAAYAQNYANQRIGDCNLVHSGGPYGGKPCMEQRRPIRNRCGLRALHASGLANSVRLGCAKVRCNNGGTFIGCNYDPPGNIIGQRPY